MTQYDPVSLKILWDRLVSIADELVLSLVRTSFSMNVREGYDLSCMIFDARARLVAQGSYSVPSFTGTAPQTIAHMLRAFPSSTLKPGDVIATNDPWMGTGHLFDINVMRPVFRGDRLAAFTMSVTHLPDVGGKGMASDCPGHALVVDVEQGNYVPISGKVTVFRQTLDANQRRHEHTHRSSADAANGVSCLFGVSG